MLKNFLKELTMPDSDDIINTEPPIHRFPVMKRVKLRVIDMEKNPVHKLQWKTYTPSYRTALSARKNKSEINYIWRICCDDRTGRYQVDLLRSFLFSKVNIQFTSLKEAETFCQRMESILVDNIN